jgi:flagellar hook protein FlgE
MFNAFTTALGALNANAAGLNIVGNNLANLNTSGFKKEVTQFHDLVAEAFRQFNQGAVQASGGNLDAAIQGEGFFAVRDSSGRSLYTRAGNFRLDANGTLMTATGEKVQGWTATNGKVDAGGAVGDIVLPLGSLLPPAVSTKFSIDANLNATAPEGTTFSVPIQAVDSLGQAHNLTVTLTRGATAGTWSYDITIPGADVGSTDTTVSVATGPDAITFDANGLMTAPTADVTGIKVSALANGAADLDLTWNLLTTGGAPRLTQYSTASAASAISTDGRTAAQLTGVELSDGGSIVAKYSGEQQRVVAQIGVATIRNPDSLVDAGDNCLAVTADTATPVIGLPETGTRGKIVAKSLESSTVDIAKEFTDLIMMQRGYQANSKVIVTSDEMTQEVINLKR